ncbi:MAG: hypothetical protein DWH91_18385 [Planctomycetota bacterium]|nr:MAG: hypothetical protein DWH91_18385 [Planctomycetota bacterium]
MESANPAECTNCTEHTTNTAYGVSECKMCRRFRKFPMNLARAANSLEINFLPASPSLSTILASVGKWSSRSASYRVSGFPDEVEAFSIPAPR